MAGRSSGYLAYTSYEYLSELIGQPNEANAFRVTASRPRSDPGGAKSLGALKSSASWKRVVIRSPKSRPGNR